MGAALGAGVVWVLSHPRGGNKSEPEEHKPETKAEQGAGGEGVVKLDKAQQASAGIQTAHPTATRVKPEVKGYGRVLDPAPLFALMLEIDSAQSALDASVKEHERVKSLFTQNQNASARALEQAEATRRHDQLQLDSARSRLLTGWGRSLVNRADLPKVVQSLITFESVIVRLEVPPADALASTPARARINTLGGQGPSLDADVLGTAPSADPQTQGQGFLLLVQTQAIPPGTAVAGYLDAPGETLAGVTLVRSAIVRHEGEAFVYVETGEGTYERKPVDLLRALADGWFVTNAVNPEAKVVITGAQQLLSEELKSRGGEE
jgi:hypothetical protein